MSQKIKKPKAHPLRLARQVDGARRAIVFVHGFTGSPESTWRQMFDLCASDPELSDAALETYSYPTRFFSNPFDLRSPSLGELAQGLRTDLSTRYPSVEEITLVGHSLGGLVIRQFITTEAKRGGTLNISNCVLYATPNTGSALAAFARTVSWSNIQLKMLCRRSEPIDHLNEDWVALDIESRFHVEFIVGTSDAIVTADSARLFKTLNAQTILGEGHASIVKPNGHDDIRYLVLAAKLRRPTQLTNGKIKGGPSGPKADPLFSFYRPTHEPFYVVRSVDQSIVSALSPGHNWVSGPSGVGKTAALVRSAYKIGCIPRTIYLGSYQDKSPSGLLRALSNELADASASTAPVHSERDPGALIQHIRHSLTILADQAAQCVIVDEVPLGSLQRPADFLDHMLQLASAVEADECLRGRVSFAMASLGNPADAQLPNPSKFAELFHPIVLSKWAAEDLTGLVDLLAGEIRPTLTIEERAQIIDAAQGSPRFVKRLFGRWHHGTSGDRSLPDLLRAIAQESIR